MSLKMKRTARITFDIIIFVALCVAEYAVNKWFEPYKRGFFCSDDSLRYPFRESTHGAVTLVVVVLAVPGLVIIAVELFKRLDAQLERRHKQQANSAGAGGGGGSYRLGLRLQQCYAQLGYYLFGLALTVLTTELTKRCVGRLRPHFFAVCQPLLADGSTCADEVNEERYVLEYNCQGGQNYTDKVLEQVGMSFPSAHTSIIFYGMLYTSIYLQAVLSTRISKLLKHLLQFVFMMFAWYMALTRISDHWHHWTDVLAGVVLGSLLAVYAAVFVAGLFRRMGGPGFYGGGGGGGGRVPQLKPSGTANGTLASVKSATAVLPAYTFGSVPYLHHTHPHHQYAQSYHNYGYVP